VDFNVVQRAGVVVHVVEGNLHALPRVGLQHSFQFFPDMRLGTEKPRCDGRPCGPQTGLLLVRRHEC
jgi:hypothetical protein